MLKNLGGLGAMIGFIVGDSIGAMIGGALGAAVDGWIGSNIGRRKAEGK